MSPGRQLKIAVIALAVAGMIFFLTVLSVIGTRPQLARRKKVARIDIIGPIISAGETIEQIKKFREDDSVGVILVRIDSPGGAVSPSQDIYAELMKARDQAKKKKRVVASIGSLGASGGYYIAAAANRIYASPGSLVGSIGVILELTRFEELFRKIGLESEVVKSGPYKDIGSPLRKMTADERKLLQGVIDDTQRQFIQAVAQGRRLPEEKVIPLADGRIFTGAQAKELGLVDELGTYEDALAGAARLAGIEGKPEVVRPKKKLSWKTLFEDVSSLFRGSIPGADAPGLFYLWRP